MDAYNRGYNSGVIIDPSPTSPEVGEQIGSAVISKEFSSAPTSEDLNASFFALAYSYAGGKIISYRGTDDPTADLLSAYLIGAGSATEVQAKLAINFYNAVDSQFYQDDPRVAPITLTGHSL